MSRLTNDEKNSAHDNNNNCGRNSDYKRGRDIKKKHTEAQIEVEKAT